MIEFLPIDDNDPVLAHSPMVRAIEATFAYIKENGPIGLTPSKAFKRVFVHWAAAHFDWPGYSEEELFSINKVLNKIDYPPLIYIHEMLTALKIGRHYKNSFRLTKAGQSLAGHPGKLFGIVTPFYLFECNHDAFARRPEPQLGNWDVFLNVLNVEAENGTTGGKIRQVLYGDPDPADLYDHIMSSLYLQILRPLCWAGLLSEQRKLGTNFKDIMFTKTPLWHSALKLDTDSMVKRATRH